MNEKDIEIQIMKLKSQLYDQLEVNAQYQAVIRNVILGLAEAFGVDPEVNSLEDLMNLVKERL